MRDAVKQIWPELDWIQDPQLREQVTSSWVLAFERSPLEPKDLEEIPFTLLIPDCPATFMEHKRCVVHIARKSAEAREEFLGRGVSHFCEHLVAGGSGPMSATRRPNGQKWSRVRSSGNSSTGSTCCR